MKLSGASNRQRQRHAEAARGTEADSAPLYLRNLPSHEEKRARRVLWQLARGVIGNPDAPDAPPDKREAWRLDLRWLLQVLPQADESTARFRALGPPPATEAERRQWEARMNAEGMWQRATFPGIAPEKRFEGVNRGAATGGLVSDKAKLGEIVERMEQMTAGIPAAQTGAK